jgi:hypothetical protein
MNTVSITSDLSKVQLNPFLIDYVYPDLMNFANDIVYKPA